MPSPLDAIFGSMKFPSPALVLLVCASILSAVTPASAKSPKGGGAHHAGQEESEKPPFVGMTKAQALSRYGEPKKRTVTDDGESWVYVLNMGEAIGKAFIPFNFRGTTLRTGVLVFGSNGKVKKFTWDAETKD